MNGEWYSTNIAITTTNYLYCNYRWVRMPTIHQSTNHNFGKITSYNIEKTLHRWCNGCKTKHEADKNDFPSRQDCRHPEVDAAVRIMSLSNTNTLHVDLWNESGAALLKVKGQFLNAATYLLSLNHAFWSKGGAIPIAEVGLQHACIDKTKNLRTSCVCIMKIHHILK